MRGIWRAIPFCLAIWGLALYLEVSWRHPQNWLELTIGTIAYMLVICGALALLFWIAVRIEAIYLNFHARHNRRPGNLLDPTRERLP